MLGVTLSLTMTLAIIALASMQAVGSLASFQTQQTAYRYANTLQQTGENYIVQQVATQVQSNPNSTPSNIAETTKTALCPTGSSTSCPFYGTYQMTVEGSTTTGGHRGTSLTSSNLNSTANEQRTDATLVTRVYAADQATLLSTISRQIIIRTYPVSPYATVETSNQTTEGTSTTGDVAGNTGWSASVGNTEIHTYTHCQIPSGATGSVLTYYENWCATNYPGVVLSNGDTVEDTSSYYNKTFSDPNAASPSWSP
jgi:hypothetical protein